MEQLCQDIDNGLCALEDMITNTSFDDVAIIKKKKFTFLQIEINRKIQKAMKYDVHHQCHDNIQQKKDKFQSIIEAGIQCLGANICLITKNLDKMNEITPLLIKEHNQAQTNKSSTDKAKCSDMIMEFYMHENMKSNAINIPLNEVSMPMAPIETFLIFKDKSNIIIGIALLIFITLTLLDIYYRVSTNYHYNQF